MRRYSTRFPLAARCAAIVILLSCPIVTLSAQLPPAGAAATGPLFPGELRLSLSTFWERYDSRSGLTAATEGTTQPLGQLYSASSLGVTSLPSLTPLQTQIAELADIPGFSLSLGSSQLRAEVFHSVTPFTAEVGLTRRLSFGVAVPLVRTTFEGTLVVNPDGSQSNVGFNPALDAAGARSANVAVRNQLTSASALLETRLNNCNMMPEMEGCAVLLARASESQMLITQSRAFRDRMEMLLGSDTATARLFIPLEGSAAWQSIESRLDAFNTLYRDLLALSADATDPVGLRPVGAQTPLTSVQLRQFLQSADAGILLSPFSAFQRQGIGDLEVHARYWIAGAASGRIDTSAALRLNVSVTGRLGTGTPAAPDVPFERGTGDGQNDVEFGAATNIRLTAALSVSAQGRFGLQLPADITMRIARPSDPFPEAFTQNVISRDLGDYADIAVQPRLNLGRWISLSGMYHSYSKQMDRHTGSFSISGAETGRGDILLDAAILDEGTEISIQRGGAGIRVSNFTDRPASETRMPVEFSAFYSALLSSTGYGVPDASTLSLQLRVYTRLFGS